MAQTGHGKLWGHVGVSKTPGPEGSFGQHPRTPHHLQQGMGLGSPTL